MRMPHDAEAEKSFLGSVMLDVTRLDETDVRPDDLFDGRHQTVLKCVEALREKRIPVDTVSVATELTESGQLDEAGGVEYIAELIESVPHAAHAKFYAATVLKNAKLRGIIAAAQEACHSAEYGEPEEVIAQVEMSLQALRERTTGGEIISMDDAVSALETREANPAAITPTGLTDLDRQIRGGLRAGQFIIAAGRPGSGKSVLGAQIVLHAAESGKASLIVSLEMDRSELAERFSTSIDRQQLRGLPVWLTDVVFEASKIAAVIRQAKRKHGIEIVFLDYLQLSESSDRKASRERQVAEVSRMCKRLAGELKIPVIAGCQLNRQSETEKRLPKLSDLRESGSIEQDADIVILLHRESEGLAKAIISKQRNGRTGVVPLTFRGDRFRFENHSSFPDGVSFGSDQP